MANSFLDDNSNFSSWSLEHISILALTLLLGLAMIIGSKRYLGKELQTYFISFFTILLAWTQISKVFIELSLGTFDVATDMPLQLCNIMPFVLPFALFHRNQRFWAVCYFFIMAGTFQALITPTLTQSLPFYEAFRYWIVHGGLVIAVLYPIFVWDFKVIFKDVFVGWWSINVFGFLMMIVSIPLGGNYLYMLRHPDGNTIYNLLGEWPWYVISLEFLALVLFGILYLPFWKMEKRDKRIKY